MCDKLCDKCVCKGCHDYACSLWRCYGYCKKEGISPLKECDQKTERDPDWREEDGEEWM